MEKSIFKFRVKEIAVGWCDVELIIHDNVINFCASYLGPNPLDSFIEACADFSDSYSDGEFNITWYEEPGSLHITLKLEENNFLHIDIKLCTYESDDDVIQEWHETIPYECFESAIIAESFRVLKTYGIQGYRMSWLSHTDFPIAPLLSLITKASPIQKGDTYYTDIDAELKCLMSHIHNNI